MANVVTVEYHNEQMAELGKRCKKEIEKIIRLNDEKILRLSKNHNIKMQMKEKEFLEKLEQIEESARQRERELIKEHALKYAEQHNMHMKEINELKPIVGVAPLPKKSYPKQDILLPPSDEAQYKEYIVD